LIWGTSYFGAATIGGILLPTRAADDTPDGTLFAAVPPPLPSPASQGFRSPDFQNPIF
jgi:hypothetical protein